MRACVLGWLWLALGLLSFGPGPGFRERYRALVQQGKRQEAKAIVTQWEQAAPQDPDLYVAKFNLLLLEGEVLSVSTKPAREGDFSLRDAKTGQEAGSIGGGGYNPEKVQQALKVLRQGIALAPDRLDMRFGLAKATDFIDDPAQQYQVLREALAWRQSAPGRPWRWRDGGPLPAPEAQFVPATLEEYMVPYWQSGTPAGYQRALALTELVLKYYPASPLGYFNKGNYYAFTANDPEAYKWFAEADKRNSDDPQNINNLLRISLNLKQKAAAQGYLARLRSYPDFQKDCQQYAAEIQQL